MRTHVRRRAGLALLVALAAGLGLVSFGAQRASAVLVGPPPGDFCGSSGATAIAGTNTFECDYTTTTQINTGPGGGLFLLLTGPAGTVFASATGPAGCTTTAFPPFVVVSACAANVAPGAVIATTLTGGGTAGPVTMSETYNGGAPAAAAPFLYQFDGAYAGVATVTTATGVAAPTGIACTNTTAPGSPLQPGSAFSCTVTYPAGEVPLFATVTSTGTATTTLVPGPTTSTRPAPNAVGWECATPGPAITAASVCTTFTFTGTATGVGTLAFSINSFALGAAVPFSAAATPAVTVGGGPAFVFAGVPTIGVIGCANSNLPTDIQFATQPGLFPGTNVVSSGQQNVVTYDGATNVLGQATLSVVAPTAIAGLSTPGLTAVECGAVFQDNDVDPNLIDGGTITFSLGGFTANGLVIAQILEGGLNTTTAVPCGGFQAGTETCQGATTVTAVPPPSGAPCTPAGPACLVVATPTPSNIVHVGLRQGISFSLIGGISPAITISATYQRLQAYGPFFSLGTNSATIAITTPTYSMSLTPSPASIPAALGSTIGSTITAALSRATAFQCVSVAGGFSGFVVCGTPGGIVPGTAPLISFVNGAEPGVVTFSTSSGVFGLPGQPTASAQQIASVHCGAAPGTAPIFLVPFVGQPFSFSFSSCQSVSVTLFGGGAAGTAVVTAVYVGDFTGATATAATTVALTVSSPTVSLTRGCNEVITGPTTPAAATATQILALVSPSSVVVSIWQFNNGLHAFQALYFSTAGAPVDITSVGPNQSIFICVSGAATFTVQ